MEKLYQVFISSTKEDLSDARQEVSQALLKAKCFPVAMELFPAADEGISDFIRQKIDESDYFIIISAGRYGSINRETGVSYTEEEYDYAMETGKPIIRLVHKNPFETLPGSRIDQDPAQRERLERFHEKIQASRLAYQWESDRELGAQVVLGILDTIERHPAKGWTRGGAVSSDESLKKILELEDENRTLSNQLAEFREKDAPDLPELDIELPPFMRAVSKKVSDKPLEFLADWVGLIIENLASGDEILLDKVRHVVRNLEPSTSVVVDAMVRDNFLVTKPNSSWVKFPTARKVLPDLEMKAFLEGNPESNPR